jgi:hypothetical protein
MLFPPDPNSYDPRAQAGNAPCTTASDASMRFTVFDKNNTARINSHRFARCLRKVRCVSLFDGCDNADDLDVTTPSDASAATNRLSIKS